MTDSLAFMRVHLARPIEHSALVRLASRLMAVDVPRPVVFETRSTPDGVRFLLGCPSGATGRLKELVVGSVPGTQFEAATRRRVAGVARLSVSPRGAPLADPAPEAVAAGVFTSLATVRKGEEVAVQLVLGRSRRPRAIDAKAADPLQPLGSRLLTGPRPIATDVRARLNQRLSMGTVEGTIRFGVTAESEARRRSLTWRVFGSLQVLESPNTRLSLVRDTAERWHHAQPGRGALVLAPSDVALLSSWPLGDTDYPGVDSVNPRRLHVPEIVSSDVSIFGAGTSPGPTRLVGIDPQSRLQHVVAIGPTGSGKSTMLEHLILSDIAARRACAVIEPKRQLIDSILERVPLSAADQIVVIDASDARPVGFNPLDVGDRDPDIVVDGILAALAAVFGDGWGPRTEYLIHGALLSLARAGQVQPDPFTLLDVPRVLTDAALRRTVVSAVADDPDLAAFWAEFDAMRPGQRAAMIAAPLNKLRKLVLRKPLAAILGQPRPRFRLRDIFREHKVVLVPLNDALIGVGAAKLLGSLIVAELWMATLERAREREPMKRPGMIFIDEVQNYLHLPTSIADALATSRSYGVGWHLAHQYRAQLPTAMRAALDTNARTKIAFAVGPDDARDLARMAPELTAADFQALPRFEVYAHLIAGGIPAGWTSARTLEPAPVLGFGDELRALSQDVYGGVVPRRDPAPVAAPDEAENSQGARVRPATHQKARRP